jgi:hypothetical protein
MVHNNHTEGSCCVMSEYEYPPCGDGCRSSENPKFCRECNKTLRDVICTAFHGIKSNLLVVLSTRKEVFKENLELFTEFEKNIKVIE